MSWPPERIYAYDELERSGARRLGWLPYRGAETAEYTRSDLVAARIADAVREERARIVAWLRSIGSCSEHAPASEYMIRDVANAIEREEDRT